jgi:hypothetical protein
MEWSHTIWTSFEAPVWVGLFLSRILNYQGLCAYCSK